MPPARVRLGSGRAGSPVAPPAFSLVRGAAGMRLGSVDEGSLARDQPGAGRLQSGRAVGREIGS